MAFFFWFFIVVGFFAVYSTEYIHIAWTVGLAWAWVGLHTVLASYYVAPSHGASQIMD